jgi:hypothetical protein
MDSDPTDSMIDFRAQALLDLDWAWEPFNVPNLPKRRHCGSLKLIKLEEERKRKKKIKKEKKKKQKRKKDFASSYLIEIALFLLRWPSYTLLVPLRASASAKMASGAKRGGLKKKQPQDLLGFKKKQPQDIQ